MAAPSNFSCELKKRSVKKRKRGNEIDEQTGIGKRSASQWKSANQWSRSVGPVSKKEKISMHKLGENVLSRYYYQTKRRTSGLGFRLCLSLAK